MMLSGIGPKNELEKFGIETILDNPRVGNNLQDHFHFRTLYEINVDRGSSLFDPRAIQNHLEQFKKTQIGPEFTTGPSFLGFDRVSDTTLKSWGIPFPHSYPDDWPHFEYAGSAAPSLPSSKGYFATMVGILNAVTSKGTIRLRSAVPADQPIIDLNILQTDWDKKLAVELFRQ
jgi:choline dehydrogenase